MSAGRRGSGMSKDRQLFGALDKALDTGDAQ